MIFHNRTLIPAAAATSASGYIGAKTLANIVNEMVTATLSDFFVEVNNPGEIENYDMNVSFKHFQDPWGLEVKATLSPKE